MQEVYSYPLSTKKGIITIQVGQCFRPNNLTKKIYHFRSTNGYATWVITTNHGATLSFFELSEAIDRAMSFIGAFQEVA